MKTIKAIAALLGAGALVVAMFGTALAATPASDAGITPTFHDGNITAASQTVCASGDVIETGNTGGSDTTDNGVTVTWTYDAGTKEFGFSATDGLVSYAFIKGGDGYNEYDYTGEAGGGIASDGGLFAPDTNGDGNPQGLSHAVFCTVAGEEEETPTPPVETPSPTPSFGESFGDITDAPSEPQTDAFGSNGTSGPADGAWLLVVALGVLLASIVVLTPARAKNRR